MVGLTIEDDHSSESLSSIHSDDYSDLDLSDLTEEDIFGSSDLDDNCQVDESG